jgi:hypothetical protein
MAADKNNENKKQVKIQQFTHRNLPTKHRRSNRKLHPFRSSCSAPSSALWVYENHLFHGRYLYSILWGPEEIALS